MNKLMEPKTFEEIKNLKKKLNHKLIENEKTLFWFWENFIKGHGLVYSSLAGRLNGYGGKMSEEVKTIIQDYIGEKF